MKRLALGTATASYQIEGASTEDGRGPSIWDTFAARPGTTADGRDGSVACDSYHRLDDDLGLLEGLGAEWYRFSIAWPRIQPEGTGRVEERGFGYYERLVDGLLERGITPAATLYHWDLPQALEDRGGWLERSTAEAFADYAALVHERLGDRVAVWATHNEPWCAAYLGYAAGVHAPGRREGGRAHRAAHHLVLSHGLAAERLHAAGAEVGIVLNLAPIWGERAEAAAQVDGVDAIRNRVWLDPLVDGAYDEGLLARRPRAGRPRPRARRRPRRWSGAPPTGSASTTTRPSRPDVAHPDAPPHPEQDAYPGRAAFSLVVREPVTDIGWEIDARRPRGAARSNLEAHRAAAGGQRERRGLRRRRRASTASCRTTTGSTTCATTSPPPSGPASRAPTSRAYLVWTLLDNFEWAEGYTKTFGLVHVDAEDQTRTPKASYRLVRRAHGARRSRAPR